MNIIITIILWLYTCCLRLYPLTMREQFSNELLTVFTLRLRAAQEKGWFAVFGVLWAELCDLPGIMLRSARHNGAGQHKWTARAAIWAAMSPFLSSALFQISNGLNKAYPTIASFLQPWSDLLILSSWILILIVGIARGLPRWSLPGIGCVLGWIGFVLNGGATVAGLRIPWRIIYPDWVHWFGELVLPLLGTLTLVIIICAALPWLRPLFWRWRRDWTQLSFLIYGFMLVSLETLDMNPYEVPLSVAGLVILAGGAWAYMRAPITSRRLISLLSAITLMMVVMTLGDLTLAAPEWRLRFSPLVTLEQALSGWLWLLGMLLVPALLSLLPDHKTPAAALPHNVSVTQSSETSNPQSASPDKVRPYQRSASIRAI